MQLNALTVKEIFPVEKFDFSKFNEKNAICFTGAITRHPFEEDKFILICDPLSEHTQFIEFSKKDLLFIEYMPSLTTKEGESIVINKLWVTIGSIAIKFEPFIVGKTRDVLYKKMQLL